MDGIYSYHELYSGRYIVDMEIKSGIYRIRVKQRDRRRISIPSKRCIKKTGVSNGYRKRTDFYSKKKLERIRVTKEKKETLFPMAALNVEELTYWTKPLEEVDEDEEVDDISVVDDVGVTEVTSSSAVVERLL